MRVLGLSFSGHGSAICLVEDGKIKRAVNLERITRIKPSLATIPGYVDFWKSVLEGEFHYEIRHEPLDFYDVFPHMLRYVTGSDNLKDAGIDLVVKYPDSLGPLKVSPDDECADYYHAQYQDFLSYFEGTPLHFELEHHLAHAYQAFLCSPFEESAVLTIDGSGERLERLDYGSVTTSLCTGRGNRIQVHAEVFFPSSLGGGYSTFTHYLGFGTDQEGKTMALAAYGTDAFYRQALDSYRLMDDGRFEFRANKERTSLLLLDRMKAFCPPREPDETFESRHFDLAWGVQRICEDILINCARGLHKRTGLDRLAMAGGVTLNCVANRKILAETPIRELYIMPNAGDRGLAAGCALYGHHVLQGGHERHPPSHDYLGHPYSEDEILALLTRTPGIRFRRCENIALETATRIADGHIVGWFQGGAEFGPRALGHRSILADPRKKESKSRLDRGIKRREWFRPYAPSVLVEHCNRFFDLDVESSYMLLAAKVRPEYQVQIQGVVHVDGTARIQTVAEASNPLYYRLISEYHRLTGIPMVLNTSFNRNGEPIVETPHDALDCFLDTELDGLAIADFLVWKEGVSY